MSFCRCTETLFTENEQQIIEVQRADKSLFVQELLLITLTDFLNIDDSTLTGSQCDLKDRDQQICDAQAYSSDEIDETQVLGAEADVEPTDSLINCNENERPSNLLLYNFTPKQITSPSQPLQQHLQQPLLEPRQTKSRQIPSGRSGSSGNTSNSNRNVNSRNQSSQPQSTQTSATRTSARRKVLRGQSNEPPQPH